MRTDPSLQAAPADLSIRELTPELLDDYLGFFDRDAFSDNPAWAGCYCRAHHYQDAAKPWRDATAAENRAAVCGLIAGRRMRGLLAYAGGKPVAWCNAEPRTMVPWLDPHPVPDAGQVGSVVCFVVAAAHRRQGLTRRLLEAACEGFRRQGLTVAEAYPRRGAEGDAHNYHGPLGLYLDAGFQVFHETGDLVVVRKSLA